MNFFDKVNRAVRESEASVVNLLSAIAPWAAPLAPAYMSYANMRIYLDFPNWVALAVALVVEILGLSTISTSMEFWRWNKRAGAKYAKAPVQLAIATFLFYLLIVLLMNVALEASGENPAVIVAARAMLTLLSVPAALVLAMRTQHTHMVHDLQSERAERRAERTNTAVPNEQPHTQRTNNRTNGEKRDKVMEYIRQVEANEQRLPRVKEVTDNTGVAKSYASEVLRKYGGNGHAKTV